MKTKVWSFLFVFLCGIGALADLPVVKNNETQVIQQTQTTYSSQPTQAQKQVVVSTDFENCVKTYNTGVENLFYLTLAAINANNYVIDEIQSRTGYISFQAGQKTLLASLTAINDKSSMIKITPMDNSYNFSQAVVDKIFLYLTTNIK